MERVSRRGLTFLEVMISIFILGSLFIFCLPFFVTSRWSTTQEGMTIKATQVSQGIIDRIKLVAHAVYGEGNSYYYDVLHLIYSPLSAPDMAVNSALFKDTPFITDRSYVVVYPEKTGGTPPDDIAKRVVVHLEWRESRSGASTIKAFTNASYVGRPAVSFARDPSSAIPPAGFTVTTTVATTSMLTTSVNTSTVAPTTTQVPTTTSPASTSTVKPTTSNTTTVKPTTSNTTTVKPTTTNTTTVKTTSVSTTSVVTTTSISGDW